MHDKKVHSQWSVVGDDITKRLSMDNSQDQKKPNTFHRAVIAIALADGHNYVQNKPWRESVCLHDYQSKKDEADGLTLIKPVGYRRPEAKGKNFFQLYLCVPYFMLLSTIVQIGVFIYYYTGDRCEDCNLNYINRAIMTSNLLVTPKDKMGYEFWRLYTYQFVHAGWEHLFGNCLMQLLIGIPLEMVHGPLRVGLIYSIGVIVGGCTDLIVTPTIGLVGASGGVYALLTAFIANIVINFDVMTILGKIARLIPISVFLIADIAGAVQRSISTTHDNVSWAAHLGGGLTGFTLGLFVLKNFFIRKWEQKCQWASFALFILLILLVATLLISSDYIQ